MSDERAPRSRGDVATAILGAAGGAFIDEYFDPFVSDAEIDDNEELVDQELDVREDLNGLIREQEALDAARPVIVKRVDEDGAAIFDIAEKDIKKDIKSTESELDSLNDQIDTYIDSKDTGAMLALIALGAVGAYVIKRHGGKAVRALQKGFDSFTTLKSGKQDADESEDDHSDKD